MIEDFCENCGVERMFDIPPCADGHGGDCPERACTVCDCAIFVGLRPIDEQPRRLRRAA